MKEQDFYSEEEARDILFGKVGTTLRDEYESELKTLMIGEAIKKARIENNLTQTELGDRIGIQKSQISKIENGHNITFPIMMKIFKAMNINAQLDMGDLGVVVL